MRRDVAVGLALPPGFAAGALLAYAAIGDISEPSGEDAMLSLPQGRAAPAALGLLALVALVGHLTVRWRPIRPPREAWHLLAMAVAAGVGLGLALRVLSARAYGANIGGGMILFGGPILALSMAAYARRWWRALSARLSAAPPGRGPRG